jgi:hypothetical protein
VLGVLAAPWFVHAAVVGLSGLGARPLASRAAAAALLVAGVAGAVALASFARRAHPSGPRASWPEPSPALPHAARRWARVLGWAALFAFALGVWAALALPIIAYDALGYRLPVIAQWLDAGRVAWVTSDDPVRNGYPLGQEAISAVVVAATAQMRCASATSFVFVAAGALSIAWLAEASGVSRALARAAGALFVLAPATILNAPSGYVDAAFAGAVVALFCTAALWWSRQDPWRACAAGMAAAHVLALKGTGIAFAAVIAGCLALASLWRARGASPASRRAAVRGALLAAVCALPGAFWVLRNVVHTGNPLWPMEIKVAGHTLFHGVASMDAVLSAASNTPHELAHLPEFARIAYVWLQVHGSAIDFDERLAGLGWAFPFAALPALVARAVAGARERREHGAVAPGDAALFLITLMAAGCFALQPLRWWPRYSLWLWGPGALALASCADAALRAGRTRALGVGLALVATLAVAEGAFASVHAKGAHLALARRFGAGHAAGASITDPRQALNAAKWVAPKFWDLGIERDGDVCRGAWKPATDNANLDGVWAQLELRPRVHVVPDDDADWQEVRAAWRKAGCARLLLLHGSPVLNSARLDPEVDMVSIEAFDRLAVVGLSQP